MTNADAQTTSLTLTATRTTPTTVDLAWTDTDAFGTYTVMRATSNGTYCMLAMTHGGVTAYTDRAAPPELVSYYVTAARSNTVNVDPTPPGPLIVIAQGVGGINVLTPLAQRNGVVAEVGVIDGTVQLIFHAASGSRSFPAAPLESPNATTVWTTDTECWLWSDATAYRVTLDRPGLPTSIFITKAEGFGDSDSRNAPSIGLANGGVLGAWTQHSPPSGLTSVGANPNDLAMGFAYRAASGRAQSLRFTVPADGGGNITAATVAMCQHPADGRIWAFIKRDGYHWISAVELFINAAGTPTIFDIVPRYISQDQDGDNGPEGEFPDLKALPDPDTGTIRLAYQCKVAKTFDSDPSHFVKGAQIVVASIDVDGHVTFPLPRLEQWVERSTSLSLSLVGGQPCLGYRYLGPDGTANDLQWSQWDGHAWTPPALLSTTRLPQSALGDSRTFWIVEQSGDLRQVTP